MTLSIAERKEQIARIRKYVGELPGVALDRAIQLMQWADSRHIDVVRIFGGLQEIIVLLDHEDAEYLICAYAKNEGDSLFEICPKDKVFPIDTSRPESMDALLPVMFGVVGLSEAETHSELRSVRAQGANDIQIEKAAEVYRTARDRGFIVRSMSVSGRLSHCVSEESFDNCEDLEIVLQVGIFHALRKDKFSWTIIDPRGRQVTLRELAFFGGAEFGDYVEWLL